MEEEQIDMQYKLAPANETELKVQMFEDIYGTTVQDLNPVNVC